MNRFPITVDRAWAAYQQLAQALIDTPRLATDRTHMQRMAEAEARWKSLYLEQAA